MTWCENIRRSQADGPGKIDMLNTLFTIASFVVAIGLLIVVHEFGHYWVARKVGVKVLRFSVGFGKPLYCRRYGQDQTEFVVAAFPLGGYVKMLDETEGPVDPAERDRAFNRKGLLQRTAVVAAGPVFNLVFAVFAYWLVYTAGVDGFKPLVGHVVQGSLADKAGFQVGDTIVSVNGKEVQTWAHRRLYLYEQVIDRQVVRFEVVTDAGDTRKLELATDGLSIDDLGSGLMGRGFGLYVDQPVLLPVIGKVTDGPAAAADLKPGDRILAVNDLPVATWGEMAKIIHASPAKEIRIRYRRQDSIRSVSLVTKKRDVNGQEIGLIGVAPMEPEIPPSMIKRLQYGPGGALIEAVDQTWMMSTLTLKMLGKMITREVSTENISGPITIAQYAGQSASVGLTQFIVFLAVISISLGVLNLLPIPVLDGGHLLYYGIEAIKGSPVSEQARFLGQQVGLVMLAMMMILAFYNDLIRIIR